MYRREIMYNVQKAMFYWLFLLFRYISWVLPHISSLIGGQGKNQVAYFVTGARYRSIDALCLPVYQATRKTQYQLVYTEDTAENLPIRAHKLSCTSTTSSERVTQGIRRDYSLVTIARKTDTRRRPQRIITRKTHTSWTCRRCIILLYSDLRQTRLLGDAKILKI